MEITDTGSYPVERQRGRPPNSNFDHLDTGPYHDIHKTLIVQPEMRFGTVFRMYAPDGYNAGWMVQEDSIVKRFRRGYPRWLAQQKT